MTTEEAIEILSDVGDINRCCAKDAEALDMAIKALEQEPDTWSLEDAREDFVDDVYNTLDFLPTNDEANQIIDSFDRVTSSIRREPCEDCISRADVLGLAKKGVLISNSNYQSVCKAINELPSVTPIRKNSISRQAVYEQINCWIGSGEYRYTNATDYLIKRITDIESLEQQLCEDCISREKAKQFLYERLDRLNDDELYDIFSRIIDDMYNELPPVTPKYTDEEIDRAQAVEQAYIDKMVELTVEELKRPKGKWISRWYGDKHFHVCSECSEEFSYDAETGIDITNYNICPNCGAKMTESED